MSELADGKLRLDRPAPHVARLTIDNPAKRNALDHAILDGIAATARELDDARCLLLTAEGPVFSAGYDIGGLPRDEFAHKAESLVAHPFHAAIAALEAFPYPAVAALNGHAIGGGLELALTCDLRLAATGAKLGMPPARLGLVYSHTGLRKFIDAIGVTRTRELFFTGRNVSTATALEWGMVNEIVAPEKLAERAVEFAAEIAANAPLSLTGNKRVIGGAAGRGGPARPRGRGGARGAARGLLPQRGLLRRSARVRREAGSGMAGTVRAAPGGDRRARAARLPAAQAEGRLRDGVQLPPEGFDFVTWDPVLKQTPNRGWRRWGTRKLVDTTFLVLREFRDANPDAPRILVGDLSRPRGGFFGARYGGLGHQTHQSGLDVDIYYPRRDGLERAARRARPGRPGARAGARRPLRAGGRDEGLRRPERAPERPPWSRHAARLPRRSPARQALAAPREPAGSGVGDPGESPREEPFSCRASPYCC